MNKDSRSMKELLAFGFICIDKPSGPTSFQVSDYVKEQLGINKTSHLGTLDPAVSGVLPIALGRACRLSKYLMRKDKSYVGIMRLHEEIDTETLRKTMKEFVGAINQLPPVRSNVKRALRTRSVYTFNYIERDGKDVLFDTDVEAGTYIRTLINDLGKKLGGAHMLELRRTSAGIFKESTASTLYSLDEAVKAFKQGNEKPLRDMIVPAEEVIMKALPTLEVLPARLKQLLTGKPIHSSDLAKPCTIEKGTYAGVFCKGRFIEIARIVREKDVVATPDFVFN